MASCACSFCGSVTGSANPVTLDRICAQCYKTKPGEGLVSRSKAKDLFLLSDKLLDSIPAASLPKCSVNGGPVKCYCVNDLLGIASQRWGDAAGLKAEIQRRMEAAEQRQSARAEAGKPMKKRPKILDVHSSSERRDDSFAIPSVEFFVRKAIPCGYWQLGGRSHLPIEFCDRRIQDGSEPKRNVDDITVALQLSCRLCDFTGPGGTNKQSQRLLCVIAFPFLSETSREDA